jgi:hypothetical protein
VTVLIEVEDGLKPAAVDLVPPLFGPIRQLGPVVADHVPGGGADRVHLVGELLEQQTVPTRIFKLRLAETVSSAGAVTWGR